MCPQLDVLRRVASRWALPHISNICFCHAYHYVARSALYGAIIVDASCAAGDLWLDSKCYRKFDRQLTWYSASNDCLSRGGSLAVYTNIGHPSHNGQLTVWLTSSATDQTYWIGLVRSWWKTTGQGKKNLGIAGSLYIFFSKF